MMQQHRGVVPLKKSSSARYRPLARSANASSGGVGEIKCCHEPNPSSARHGLRAQDVWSPRPQQRLRKKNTWTQRWSPAVTLSRTHLSVHCQPCLRCCFTSSAAAETTARQNVRRPLVEKRCAAVGSVPKGYDGFNYCLINFFYSL